MALGLSSCTSFLDMSPTDKVSDKVMWESTTNAEYHVNYLYSYIYDVLMGQCVAGQTEALTDMLKYGSYNYNALCYIPSEIAYGAATTLTAGYVDSYLGYWGSWYTGISKVNKAIVSLRKYGQMSDQDKLRLEAEMKFMRAFLYFDLMKRYKEIIIYDENLDAYAKQAKIIHFDIDASEFNKNVKIDLGVLGNCKQTLKAVTELIDEAKHSSWSNGFEPYKEKEYNKVISKALYPKEGPLLMGEVVNRVTEATENKAVLVTDVGQNQLFACRYFKFSEPRSIVTSGGMGTMGFALPAAIGATFGAPDRTVCMFCGDGGLQMTIQELGTIMEQQAPVKIILLNNNYLGNVRQWQELFFNHRYSWTPMLNPEYSLIAQGYGIPSRLVIERSELDVAIEEMLSTDGPFLLHVAVKEEDNVMPMTEPGATISDMRFE